MERAILGIRFDGHFACVGELNGVADKIDQNLRQAATVSVARRQIGSKLELKRELLVGGQRLKRAADGLGDVLNAVVGEFEHELTGLDLGEIEHVINEPKQVPTIGLKTLEDAQHLLRRIA